MTKRVAMLIEKGRRTKEVYEKQRLLFDFYCQKVGRKAMERVRERERKRKRTREREREEERE